MLVAVLLVGAAAHCRAADPSTPAPPDGFENRVSVLGVVDGDGSGNEHGGELISLGLRIREGAGEVYLSLASIHDVDTQVALRAAHRITCGFLRLPCERYDFHYAFALGRTSVVTGQSASAAVGYLLARTLRGETVPSGVAITGRLAPGAVIGLVGGIERKIGLAQSKGFSKIYVPQNAVCEDTPFCDRFRLDHRDCTLDAAALETPGRRPFETMLSCPRKRRVHQYAVQYPSCTATPAAGPTVYALSCRGSVGGADYSVGYGRCELGCDGARKCTVRCDEPSVRGFVAVKRVIALEELLEDRLPREAPSPAYRLWRETQREDAQRMARALCARIAGRDRPGADDAGPRRLEAEARSARAEIERARARGHPYGHAAACFRLGVARRALGIHARLASGALSREGFEEQVADTIGAAARRLEALASPAFLEERVRTRADLDIFLVLRDRAGELATLVEQLERRLRPDARGALPELSRAYASVVEKLETLALWEDRLLHAGTPERYPRGRLARACARLNRHLHLVTRTLHRYRVARFSQELARQTRRAGDDPGLCLYRGLELGAKLDAALNFLDLGDDAKTAYLTRFLEITRSRVLRAAADGTHSLLPDLYLERAEQSFSSGDLDDAFLLANAAIGFSALDVYLAGP